MDCSLPCSSVSGNFRKEYWSGLPFATPGDLTDPWMELALTLLHWQVEFFLFSFSFFITEPPGKTQYVRYFVAKLFLFCIFPSLPFPLVFTICLKTRSFLQLERNCPIASCLSHFVSLLLYIINEKLLSVDLNGVEII